ncbi:MAG TPA: hypothetical protein VFQ00_05115 [Terriglobales bacterium]|nr:hypothetical protein [Terriglobales bacterium]
MRKLLIAGLTALLSTAPALAQRQNGGVIFHGVPGSVTSPDWKGGLRSPSGSVTDPTFGIPGTHPNFHHRFPARTPRRVRPVIAYVPYYWYPYLYDDSMYDEPEQQPQVTPPAIAQSEPQQAGQDDSSRYGTHRFDARDERDDYETEAQNRPVPVARPEEKSEPGPMTTLVYRDGHKDQIQNYAIVGQNIVDLTRSPVLRKIPLASLDLDATRKENDDNGVDFHLP